MDWTPRAYRLKASNACLSFSTFSGATPQDRLRCCADRNIDERNHHRRCGGYHAGGYCEFDTFLDRIEPSRGGGYRFNDGDIDKVAPLIDNATATASSATSSASHAQGQGSSQGASSIKSKPVLKLVHVVGSKYVDFFTDGTTIFSFPGDPSIDANLNKPNAPIPTHGGLVWVSSKGMEAYDTASGDLDPGTYAQEANGSFITNASGSSASATSTTLVAFSLLDPTLDASPVSPALKTTEASASPSPAHAPAADTSAASTTSPLPDTSASASSTPNASTTTSASSTTAASEASATQDKVSATGTATSTAISSSVASSSFASANDNAASTTASSAAQ